MSLLRDAARHDSFDGYETLIRKLLKYRPGPPMTPLQKGLSEDICLPPTSESARMSMTALLGLELICKPTPGVCELWVLG